MDSSATPEQQPDDECPIPPEFRVRNLDTGAWVDIRELDAPPALQRPRKSTPWETHKKAIIAANERLWAAASAGDAAGVAAALRGTEVQPVDLPAFPSPRASPKQAPRTLDGSPPRAERTSPQQTRSQAKPQETEQAASQQPAAHAQLSPIPPGATPVKDVVCAAVDARALDDETALHMACRAGHTAVANLLLELGADVNARTRELLQAPVHLAALSGHVDTVRALVNWQADLLAKTSLGETALHLASAEGRPETVRLIIELLRDRERALRAFNDSKMHGAFLGSIMFAGKPLEVVQDAEIEEDDEVVKSLTGESPSKDSDEPAATSAAAPQTAAEEEDEIVPEGLDELNRAGQRPADMCKDLATLQVFREMFPHSDSYGRTIFKDQVMVRNSRSDQVRRLLEMQAQAGSTGKKATATANEHSIPELTQPKPAERSNPELEHPRAGSPRPGLSAASAELLGPESFAIRAILGKGSFGEVFLVAHRSTQRLYAMKVLQKSKILGRNLVRYALTERNVQSYLRHPFIVPLRAAFQTPQHLVLVMEFCAGGNLQQLISRERRLSDNLASLYTSEVLLALEYLHDRRAIFRDLKPDNVVLDRRGHAMLTDFGLSKEGVHGLTSATSFCGSVAYLAPEMLRRRGHGHTVDLYGLGVLLYEMLCSIPPYFSQDRERLFWNIEHQRLVIPAHVPQVTADLIRRLMDRDPAKRLGAQRTGDVKLHEYFANVDFEKVLRKESVACPIVERSFESTPFDLALNAMNPFQRSSDRRRASQRGAHVPNWDFQRHAEDAG